MPNLDLNSKWYLRIAFVLILGIAFLVEGTQVFSRPYQYQGSLIDPASPAPEINLPATRGGRFRLDDQRGKAVLLFFGFTHCPDVCPTTLNDFKHIKGALGEDARQVEFVFITVDPGRDNLQSMSEYLSIFDPAFIGLTAEEKDLEPVWDSYGIYREKRTVTGATEYAVDHTARIYVISPEGNLRLTFPQGMAPEAMADDIGHLLDEG